jgi:CLIP-associating protein 1/2
MRNPASGLTDAMQMNQTESLPFKGFMPSFVACLEDSEGAVRETAKSCVVELFR